jgi:hypothetical protein
MRARTCLASALAPMLRCSFTEVYNEDVRDLLGLGSTNAVAAGASCRWTRTCARTRRRRM